MITPRIKGYTWDLGISQWVWKHRKLIDLNEATSDREHNRSHHLIIGPKRRPTTLTMGSPSQYQKKKCMLSRRKWKPSNKGMQRCKSRENLKMQKRKIRISKVGWHTSWRLSCKIFCFALEKILIKLKKRRLIRLMSKDSKLSRKSVEAILISKNRWRKTTNYKNW